MNFSLRTSARAAAVLIAAAGALGAVEPALAQIPYERAGVAPQVMPQRVFIERFLMEHGNSFVPGQQIEFRLRGAPGGQAWFEIPGVQRPSPMTEVRPGLYEARYVIRRNDNPGAFERTTATLQANGQRVSAQVGTNNEARGGGRGPRDAAPPQISDVSPANGARVSERGWTRISAHVDDRGSGVESVTLVVDGRDVTSRTRIEGREVRYAEDLHPGRHTAELAARDRAGNVSRQAWSFFVAPEHGRGWDRDGERDHGR